jgi:hypothetical protein
MESVDGPKVLSIEEVIFLVIQVQFDSKPELGASFSQSDPSLY